MLTLKPYLQHRIEYKNLLEIIVVQHVAGQKFRDVMEDFYMQVLDLALTLCSVRISLNKAIVYRSPKQSPQVLLLVLLFCFFALKNPYFDLFLLCMYVYLCFILAPTCPYPIL